MVNPAYWALMPISMKSEKCVGITLTSPGSRNLPSNLFLTRFDSPPKGNHAVAVSAGFVSAAVRVKSEITGIRDRNYRELRHEVTGMRDRFYRDWRQVFRAKKPKRFVFPEPNFQLCLLTLKNNNTTRNCCCSFYGGESWGPGSASKNH